MPNKALLLLVCGLATIAVGAFLQFRGGSQATVAEAAACREIIGPDAPAQILAKCDEAPFARGIAAQNAEAAASAAGASNRGNMAPRLAGFLFGFGGVMALGGLVGLRRGSRTRT